MWRLCEYHYQLRIWECSLVCLSLGPAQSGKSSETENVTLMHVQSWGFPGGSVVTESTCRCRRHGFDPDPGRPHVPQSD